LDELVQATSIAPLLVKEQLPAPEVEISGRVICVHLTASQDWETGLAPLRAHQQSAIQFVSLGPGKAFTGQVRQALGDGWSWREMRHRTLGGLSNARVRVGWSGPGRPTHGMCLPKHPIRPLDRFLEPSVKLDRWSRDLTRSGCWRPASPGAEPFPWPWEQSEPWVEAPTCLLGKRPLGECTREPVMVQRPLTVKELGQILDVREDWGHDLVSRLMAWDNGETPPLRLLAETVMAVREWLLGHARGGKTDETLKKTFDWGRVRAPWLGGSPDTTDLERMAYFGWVWGAKDAEDAAVATRPDDAGVDVSLWAVGGEGEHMETARENLRKFLFRFWIRRTCREGRQWLRSEDAQSERAVNTAAMRDCIQRLANSTWWDWADGSRLLFWRWPSYWMVEARDGARGFHLGAPAPRLNFPQPPMAEEWIRAKDREKLEKLLRRRYITAGPCRNTVPRFAVPKGADDIRVVWDLKKNGLNAQMYTPTFFLPSMGTYLRRLMPEAYSGDFDIGEQFHNYVLHASERVFCGVRIPTELSDTLSAEGWEVAPIMRWDRLVFGWQTSPYLALRMLARALELAQGHPLDLESAFCWEEVGLNLPGAEGYDPGKPRISKLRADGSLAADWICYFDDGRVSAATRELALRALRQITAYLQHLGNQEAARKRRPVSQRPGAWAGGIAYTDQGLTRKFVSQKKWDRAKEFLHWLDECLRGGKSIERVRFRSGKGFLLHLSQTYEFMQPHLKGLHLAEEAWRKDRDPEGWKRRVESLDVFEPEGGFDDSDDEGDKFGHQALDSERAPPTITKIPRLCQDVRALNKFFDPPTPVQVIVRPVAGACYVVYGAGDASGEGFGSKIHPLGMQPLLRHGFWCTEDSEQTSNWREFRNLLDAIKVEAAAGRLAGRELWIATDNSTAASAYYKGSSTTEKLQDMVTELRLLTLTGNFVLNIFHIAGTRMIQIGVDGLSRGEMQLGALAGTPESAAPLHLSPLERSGALLQWIHEWMGQNCNIAKSKAWFYAAQQAGQHDKATAHTEYWVWDLPPAAALHALEELGNARLKRHEVLQGIVLVPGLLQHEWRRRLTSVTDCHFTIPAGAIPQWPKEMHEPLTVGIYLPLFRCQPWDWKRVPFLVPMGISLSKMHKEDPASARSLLCQFWSATKQVPRVRTGVLRVLLQNAAWHRFLGLSTYGRDGA
jgi:hypothetical protein